MTLVASTIPNLVSGVSQQPAPSRLRTSGEEMVNAFPSVVAGMMKRPPTEWVAKTSPAITVDDTAAVHMIDRDANERYILVCGQGDLELYDLNGVQQTVTFPNGKSYLPTTDIWRKLRFVTVADTTFILNTEQVVTTEAITETRTDPSTRASVFIERAVASVTYAIYVDGVLAGQFATSSNTSAATALEGTTEIAQGLAADLITNGYSDAVAVGTVVTFGITSGEVVTVFDQFGGAAMQPYTDTVQEFANLPPNEIPGRLVRVQGNLEDLGETYWVVFEDGVWKETVGYDAQKRLNATTMPHILVKTAPNTFEFRQNVWEARKAGDDESNPDPSFVGSRINGLFLFKGRMGMLSEENVVLSTVAFFEEHYRTTVIQALASDVIDVASVTGRVSTLYHAASFSDELILFSDKQQFRLTSGTVLDAESVGIVNSTSYPCSTEVAPVTAGASAYFVADGATHSTAREIFIDQDRQTVNGEDISVQIPSYIPLNVRSLATSLSSEILVALSNDEPSSLYVYKWYTTERRKVQSAWSKWTFGSGDAIVGIGFIDEYLYMVFRSGSEVRIERMLVGSNIPLPLLLDHQMGNTDYTTFTYDSVNNRTDIVIPSAFPETLRFFRTDDNSGDEYTATKVNNTTYQIPGDITAQTVVSGLDYEWLYQFSTQYLREENQDGTSSIQDGRLQLRYFSVIYTDTSYFEAHVTYQSGVTSVETFNGRTLADPDNILDVIPRDTGEFRFPIFGENEKVTIQLKSSEPWRASIGSVEWTAIHKPKARRV